MITVATGLTPLVGDDLEALLEENDGVGEFESDTSEGPARWSFPRFDGAESIGTCSYVTEEGDVLVPEGHEGIHTADDDCGPNWEPDQGNMYLSRSGLGPYDTDVETVAAWLAAPRTIVGAILALGEPGTGKTALIEAAVCHADRKLLTVVCTPDHTKDSLFLRFVGEGKGDCLDPTHEHAFGASDYDAACVRGPYVLGPIPFAAKYGYTLYMDEYMLLVDGVKPLTYPLADGRHFLPEGNADGSPLKVHPDFRLILSSNPQVRGASLPEPVASRCASTTITVETGAGMLKDLGIDDSVVAAWKALGDAKLFRPQVRELRLADYWLNIDPAQAVSAFLPEHCPESERRAVRDIVVSLIGGQTRLDGRLVVS